MTEFLRSLLVPPTSSSLKMELSPSAQIKMEPLASSEEASRLQRAARRDKRKMRRTGPSSSTSSGLASSDDSDHDSESDDDKSKKMKTSATSSRAVTGGLGSSYSQSLPPTPGLLFTPEIDAAGEERLRAMEAQLESLDPDSKEAKKKRRLIRNRMSAQLHRERKKAYVGQLEDQLLEKDRELRALQERLARMMEESEKLKEQKVEQVVIKQEPGSWETKEQPEVKPTPTTTSPTTVSNPPTTTEVQTSNTDWPLADNTWDLNGLDDTEMADLDLLRDFDDPFAGLGDYDELCKPVPHPHPEIHAAKKNLAMMAAVMFSVSFCGNSAEMYNVTPGSNFSSTFGANAQKEFSQMSVASRIVACLEKTSWKEFRDVSSWLSSRTNSNRGLTTTTTTAAATTAASKPDSDDDDNTDVEDNHHQSVGSPSASSDVTDTTISTCGSPARSALDLDDGLDDVMGETDLIDDFEYPVEDPFGPAAVDWLDEVGKDAFLPPVQAKLVDTSMSVPPTTTTTTTKRSKSSLTSRLYESLTALWREKNQVLLTVRDDKQQVLQRSIADMTSIREGLESGNFFTRVGGDGTGSSSATREDQSVTFLYPMSAFSTEMKPRARSDSNSDPVFLEVSCQLSAM